MLTKQENTVDRQIMKCQISKENAEKAIIEHCIDMHELREICVNGSTSAGKKAIEDGTGKTFEMACEEIGWNRTNGDTYASIGKKAKEKGVLPAAAGKLGIKALRQFFQIEQGYQEAYINVVETPTIEEIKTDRELIKKEVKEILQKDYDKFKGDLERDFKNRQQELDDEKKLATSLKLQGKKQLEEYTTEMLALKEKQRSLDEEKAKMDIKIKSMAIEKAKEIHSEKEKTLDHKMNAIENERAELRKKMDSLTDRETKLRHEKENMSVSFQAASYSFKLKNYITEIEDLIGKINSLDSQYDEMPEVIKTNAEKKQNLIANISKKINSIKININSISVDVDDAELLD